MDLLIFALIVILVLALAIYVVRLLPLGSPFSEIAQALLVVVAIIVIANRAGMVG